MKNGIIWIFLCTLILTVILFMLSFCSYYLTPPTPPYSTLPYTLLIDQHLEGPTIANYPQYSESPSVAICLQYICSTYGTLLYLTFPHTTITVLSTIGKKNVVRYLMTLYGIVEQLSFETCMSKTNKVV